MGVCIECFEGQIEFHMLKAFKILVNSLISYFVFLKIRLAVLSQSFPAFFWV